MIKKIRDSRWVKGLSLYVAFTIIAEMIQPSMALALSGGPSQPEVESFTPIGTTEMVDLFSGDFNYNIPLMDVGGYPINIAYNSGVTMDQEASWVGLGWNLNVGSIVRNMRGIPDDFNGDLIKKEMNLEPNWTFGMSVGFSTELFGLDLGQFGISYNYGAKYNNYTGVGLERSISPSVGLGNASSPGMSMRLGFSISSSNDGVNLRPSASLSQKSEQENTNCVSSFTTTSGSVSASFNSRQGLTSVNTGLSISQTVKRMEKNKKGEDKERKYSASQGVGSSVAFANNTYIPQIDMPKDNYSMTMSFTLDGAIFGSDGGIPITAYYLNESLREKERELPAYGYLHAEKGAGKGPKSNALLDFNREKDQPFSENVPHLPLSNFTYDQYQVSGQGVAGQYRPYRNDLGHVHDVHNYSTSTSGEVGFEIGTGSLADIGIDVGVSSVETNTGPWWFNNLMRSNVMFSEKEENDLYEPFHFKQVGEHDVDVDPSFLASVGGTAPVNVVIGGNKFIGLPL